MGLTIPAGEKAIDEERITLIKIIRRLSDTKNLTTLIDAVKERMRAEGVNWAESDKAIARLKDAGDDPTAINAKKFVDACREKKLPDRAVFGCLTVCKESARNLLSEREIDSISEVAGKATRALAVEFKDGITVDVDGLRKSLLRCV